MALLESIILTAVIDPKEGRDVATINNLNVFVQLDMEDKKVAMKLRSQLVKLMVKTVPEIHRQHVVVENGKTFLCIELLKNPLWNIEGSIVIL